MNEAIIQVIRNEIEKIERGSGHGIVTVKIKNGTGYQIESMQSILVLELSKKEPLDKAEN